MSEHGWPEVGEDVFYRRIMTSTPETYDLGKVLTRPLGTDLKHGVWEIETSFGSLVTRKGWELRIISQR